MVFLFTFLMSVGNVVVVPLLFLILGIVVFFSFFLDNLAWLGPLTLPSFFVLTNVLASDFSGKAKDRLPRPVSSHSLNQTGFFFFFTFFLPCYLKGRIVPDFPQSNFPLICLIPNPYCKLLSLAPSGYHTLM